MKKIIALTLSLLLIFAVVPASLSASAAEETVQLVGSDIKVFWTQKTTSYSTPTITVGDYNNDGYIAKITGCTGTGKMLMITIPSTVFDLNLTKISYTLSSASGSVNSRSYNMYLTKSGANSGSGYGYQSGSFTSNDTDLCVVNTWQEISTTGKTYNFDLTSDKYASVLTNKLNYLCIPVASNTSDGTIYINSISYTYKSSTEYDVTIDDTATKIAEGEDFTFPDTADLYVGEGTIYQAGDTITVNSECTFKSYDLNLTMQTGAAIRLNIENGIRYSTDVDKDVVAALKEAGATISFGTIIAPENKITDEFTHEDVNIDVEYKVDIGGVYNPNGFVGSIIRIKDANVNQKYVGRGYAKVTVGEVTKTVYATQSDNSRSVAYIAKAYQEANYNGDSLGDETKAIVNAWAAAYQA